MKKLIDILFEPEEEEVVVEAPLTTVNKTPVAKEVTKKDVYKNDVLEKVKVEEVEKIIEEKPVNRSRSFGIIDVEELQVKKPSFKRPAPTPSIEYESQPPLSPIFGVIKEDEKAPKPVLKTPQIKQKQNTSHLGTILSPIYGMASNPGLYDEKEGYQVEDPYADLDEIYEEYPEFDNHSLEELLNYEEDIPFEEAEISLFDEILQGDDK